MLRLTALGLIVGLCLALSSYASAQLVVNTTVGRVRGVTSYSREGRRFYQWLSIPYAMPPVGMLRFEPPYPAVRRKGVIDASSYPPKCPQIEAAFNTFTGSEDCLYLNVHSPQRPPADSRNLLPVMFFIHGGYFIGGHSKQFDPSYFMDEEVVVVSTNYRIGVLGFLNTGDDIIRGNMGMKDQALALKWVYENIANFGGDPRRITVFGESAGAVSAHMHMLSPLSKKYVYKAISQSGTAFSHWGIYKDPVGQSRWYAKETGCLQNSTRDTARCLKGKDVESLYAFWSGQSLFLGGADWTKQNIFTPTIEAIQDNGTFLSQDPEDIVKEGNFAKVPWIVGSNSGEGLVNAAKYFDAPERRKTLITRWENVSRVLLSFDDDELSLTKQVKEYYLDPVKDIQSTKAFFVLRDMLSDRNFYYDQQKAIRSHGQVAPTYPYYYDLAAEFSFFDVLLTLRGRLPAGVEVAFGLARRWFERRILRRKPTYYGACHGDELFMLTSTDFTTVSSGSPDYAFSREFVKLWVRFASDSPELKFYNSTLHQFDLNDEFKYFHFTNSPNSGVIEAPFKDRYFFWRKYEESVQQLKTLRMNSPRV